MILENHRRLAERALKLHLPKDLSTLTAEQTRQAIELLIAHPLKQLREWQAITNAQLELTSYPDGGWRRLLERQTSRSAIDRSVANMLILQRHYDTAILLKCFHDGKLDDDDVAVLMSFQASIGSELTFAREVRDANS
jgi:hypothetical protein